MLNRRLKNKMKELVISTDVGFNGIKCVVGTPEMALFALHIPDDIVNTTNLEMIGTLENAANQQTIYIVEEKTNKKETYIVGKGAKEYMQGADVANEMKTTDFYAYDKTNEEESYRRFNSGLFKKVYLAAVYNVLDVLSNLEDYKDIFTSKDYKLHIIIELPHAIVNESGFRGVLTGNITRLDDSLRFAKKTEDGTMTYRKLPEILENAEVSFVSQVISAIICELESDEQIKLPVFTLDCGGRTDGIATVEKNYSVKKSAESNTDFAIENINRKTYQDVLKIVGEDNKVSNLTEENIEEIAGSEDGKGVPYLNRNTKKKERINITEIYNKNVKEFAENLFNYCMDNHMDDVAEANTILVAGGAGHLYYDTLHKCFSKVLDNETKMLLAKGECNGHDFGAIYSVALGGYKTAAMELQQDN